MQQVGIHKQSHVQFKLRLPSELHQQLASLAAAQGRSTGSQIVHLLKHAVAEPAKDGAA